MAISSVPVSSNIQIVLNAGTSASGGTLKKTCTLSNVKAGMGTVPAQQTAAYNLYVAAAPCFAYTPLALNVTDKVELVNE